MGNTDDDYCNRISQHLNHSIRSKGYPLEIHEVATEDGYINSIYRIPHGLQKKGDQHSRTPVLLVHSLCSSVAEAFSGDNQLGYYLSENGFDVWVASCRGTTFSRGHEEYDHFKQEIYWDFSYHEIGYYDLPAFIDHILSITGFQKLFYIGLSQGSTSFAILMSKRPEYNQKIALACMLCPAIKFENARFFPIKMVFSYIIPMIKFCSQILHIPIPELPLTYSVRTFGMKYAKPGTFAESLLVKVLDIFAGHSNPEELKMNFKQFSITTPNTASSKQTLHYSQAIKGNRFAEYDYGREENLKRYGSELAPLYDLTKVTAPVGIFYSKNDVFYGTRDIDILADSLSNCVLKHLVQHEKFNHFNFMYNSNITSLLHIHVLDLINKYMNK